MGLSYMANQVVGPYPLTTLASNPTGESKYYVRSGGVERTP